MTGHNPPDDGLRRALDAIADAGADTAHLDTLLRTVRGRIRRRRAVKQVGLGATTLAVGAALALGAAHLTPHATEPGPAGPATTPVESPTAPPSPEPGTGSTPAPATTPDGTDVDTTPLADCSAAGGSTDIDTTGLTTAAAATAQALLTAAVTCDADALVALAQRDGTHLGFGGSDAATAWTLPDAEADEPVYEILRALLTQTPWARYTIETDGDATVWPRVFVPEYTADDAAWQEAIGAGAVPADLAADMRSAGGYQGWRLAVTTDGRWQFFTGGD